MVFVVGTAQAAQDVMVCQTVGRNWTHAVYAMEITPPARDVTVYQIVAWKKMFAAFAVEMAQAALGAMACKTVWYQF